MIKKATKRLSLHAETLLRLQLADVHGGGSVISKPNASCFINCPPTGFSCANTGCHCVEQ